MEDRGGRQNQEEHGSEEEEEHRMAERPEEPVGMSSEARIGQKLREIGDQFHQEHVQLVSVILKCVSFILPDSPFEGGGPVLQARPGQGNSSSKKRKKKKRHCIHLHS